MPDSSGGRIDEVRATLAVVAEQLRDAEQYTGLAHARLADAVGVLSELADETARPMGVEPMRSALDATDRLRGLLAVGVDAVTDIAARL